MELEVIKIKIYDIKGYNVILGFLNKVERAVGGILQKTSEPFEFIRMYSLFSKNLSFHIIYVMFRFDTKKFI